MNKLISYISQYSNIMEHINVKFGYLKEIMAQADWELIYNVNDTTIERKLLPEVAGIACVKASGIVDANAKELCDFIWNIYETSDLKKYDPEAESYNIIERYDENTRLCRQVNKLPWPLWPREMLYLRSKKVNDNEHWIFMFSVDSDEIPEQTDKYVRARINISAYGFIPINDKQTKVYRVMHLDPAGSIPTSVINSYSQKTLTMITEMKKIYN